jgi:hemoglobin-like flavoprotein
VPATWLFFRFFKYCRMTELQIQTISDSWQIFRSIDPGLVGDVFYTHLFQDYPQLKALFTTSREIQSLKLVNMLHLIVSRIDNMCALKPEIEALSIRHSRYGVKPMHYEAVVNALLWTLQTGLGAEWNEKVKDAWQTCYNEVAAIMMKAMDTAL